jgi:hypothetical protein
LPRGRRIAGSSSELLSERASKRLCWMRRVVAVVGDTLRERRREGDGDRDEAIVPAIGGICGRKCYGECCSRCIC